MSVSGKIDPSTLSPFGPIPPQPFVPIDGQKENIPGEEPPTEPDQSSGEEGSTPKKKPKAAASAVPLPLLPTGTEVRPKAAVSKPGMRAKDTHEQVGDMHTDAEGRIGPGGQHGLPTVKLEGARARNERRIDDGKLGVGAAGTTEGASGPRRPQGSSAVDRTPVPDGRMGISTSTRE